MNTLATMENRSTNMTRCRNYCKIYSTHYIKWYHGSIEFSGCQWNILLVLENSEVSRNSAKYYMEFNWTHCNLEWRYPNFTKLCVSKTNDTSFPWNSFHLCFVLSFNICISFSFCQILLNFMTLMLVPIPQGTFQVQWYRMEFLGTTLGICNSSMKIHGSIFLRVQYNYQAVPMNSEILIFMYAWIAISHSKSEKYPCLFKNSDIGCFCKDCVYKRSVYLFVIMGSFLM